MILPGMTPMTEVGAGSAGDSEILGRDALAP